MTLPLPNQAVCDARAEDGGARWHLRAGGCDVGTARHFEGLFAQGSGYLQLRGSLEEPVAGAPQNQDPLRRSGNVTAEEFNASPAKWGTYVPGIFADHPLLGHEMVNLPFFLGWTLEVEGEVLDVTTSTVEGHGRALDLRDGQLRRELTWHTRSGAALRVVFERFVSVGRPQTCCQRLRLEADLDVDVTVVSFLDADVRTNGFDHFAQVNCHTEDGPDALCRVTTNGGDTVEIRTRLLHGDDEVTGQVFDRRVELHVPVSLPAGGAPLTLEKRTAVITSRDLRPFSSQEVLGRIATQPWTRLTDENRAVWADRWRRCEVEIDGDPESRRALRASLYHLLRSHVPDDLRVAIDAKGAAGEAYYGRFFWDTEMFLLPFFLYTNPERARTLVDFRVHTLDGARENARAGGFLGARYAWESSTTGREECKAWPYAEQEVHVSADVVYGWAHFARAVDPDYLLGTAAEAIVETARFWADYVVEDREEIPHLYDVLGPDEYTPSCTDNAFTNQMVRFALRCAVQVGKFGGAGREEQARFREIARRLPVLRDAERHLVLQCAEFEGLKRASLKRIWRDRSRPLSLQLEPERLYRLRVLKQADVLMMMMLFPDDFTDEEVQAAWDYYEPITTHDSSLSAGVHGLVAGRLGRSKDAWRYWCAVRDIDLDPRNGGAAEGIHIANAGAAWMTAVHGFAGLRSAMWTEVLTLDPRLPVRWNRLAFPLVWKGVPVRVEITRERTRVTNDGPAPLDVRIAGEARTVAPGKTQEFPTGDSPGRVLGAVLFDLDGVLVSTDHLHFRAWSRLAEREGIPFDWETNHRLRGVSRRDSLEIILERAARTYTEDEMQEMLEFKNELYRDSLADMTPADVLPGSCALLAALREAGIPTAVVSASRNAAGIVERTGLRPRVDELVDGTDTERSKPDPECFLLAAKRLGVAPENCLVIEDAPAGLEAARCAGMDALAVGDRARHPEAARIVAGLDDVTVADLRCPVPPPGGRASRATGGGSREPRRRTRP